MVKEIPKLHGPVDKFKKKVSTIDICGPNVPPPPKRRLGAFSGPGRPFTNPKRRSAVILEGRFRIICNVKMWWAPLPWKLVRHRVFFDDLFLGRGMHGKEQSGEPTTYHTFAA